MTIPRKYSRSNSRKLNPVFLTVLLFFWSTSAWTFQVFNRATVESLAGASGPASILRFVNPVGSPPPIATYESPSPRILIGSFLTVDNARYCTEDWLSIFTVELFFRENGSPSPNQQGLESSVGLILDGQELDVDVPNFAPFRAFDDGGFPNVWGRVIGNIVAPGVDDGEPVGDNIVLELGEHELTLTLDGVEEQTITFFVDGPESDTCNSICRGMNLPAQCS